MARTDGAGRVLVVTPRETAYRDQMRRQITEGIRRHGCFVVYVSDDVECSCCRATGGNRAERRARRRPARRSRSGSFAYTIGLHGIGHPELLVFGLDPRPSQTLLTRLAHEVRDHALDLVPGEVLPGGVDVPLPVLVESLPNPGQILHQANDFYRRPPEASVEGLQLSWPDPRGRWPGDPGCVRPAAAQPRPGTFRC